MNKKEISEIRRLLTKDHCRIDKICGFYVTEDMGQAAGAKFEDMEQAAEAMYEDSVKPAGAKFISMEMKLAFLSLPEEDMHKYCAIFRKTLSGTIGKHLMTLEFPIAEEAPDGRQAKLLALRDCALDDDDLLRSWCEELIHAYPEPGNYLVLFAFGRYDIPTRTKDHMTLDDASEDVYSFIVCSICPVALSKEGLCYDADKSGFFTKLRDQMVQMPAAGFLFPAFEDRNTDIHQLLYYTAKPSELHDPLLTEVLGIEPPLTAETQQTTFQAIVEETFRRDCDFEVAKSVHEKLGELVQESAAAEEPEPPVLDKHAVRGILSDCGATDEQLEKLDKVYDELAGEEEIMISNVYAARKFEVSAPDVKVSLSADRTDLIETRVIGGQEYLMIPLSGDVEVNGIRIRGKRQEELD